MTAFKSIIDAAVRHRHHLHRYPELSGRERQTADYVCDCLARLGIPFSRDIGGHGIVATIRRGESGGSVGLRCELDALPIDEGSDIGHRSRLPGAMHACGHDGHMAALLGAGAALLATDGWQGSVHLIFQPAEETGVGARAMLDDGLFERFACDRIFAFHNYPGLEVGTIAVHDTAVMAAGNQLAIRIEGASSHAATPHLARDPIIAAGHLIVSLQTAVARALDPSSPMTVSLTTIHAGTAANQIPSSVDMTGTLRTFDEQDRQAALSVINDHCARLATTFDVDINFTHRQTSKLVSNHPQAREMARKAASVIGAPLITDLKPSAIGDDFAEFLGHVPGAYAWIGNGPVREAACLHQERYDFNDRLLETAIPWLVQTAILSLSDRI